MTLAELVEKIQQLLWEHNECRGIDGSLMAGCTLWKELDTLQDGAKQLAHLEIEKVS